MLNIVVDMMSLILLLKIVCKEAGAKSQNINFILILKVFLAPRENKKQELNIVVNMMLFFLWFLSCFKYEVKVQTRRNREWYKLCCKYDGF